ncbi:hypothetical protein BKA63DRAFT_476707 [Paraphoma chrysanthemicola]|nr:hypothetical protein BKA63DRAFT_476707 [Paraphoma chrysanthemicola]
MPPNIYDQLVEYSAPPNNYIGTAIFLSYIVLALYATLSIASSLYTQYTAVFHTAKSTPPPTSSAESKHVQAANAARRRHIKIYTFLASLSFAALSYHMLSFLITHHVIWTGKSKPAWSSGALDLQLLQQWMLSSTLFGDFARDLVREPQGMVWTQLAILETWGWGLWIGWKARQHILPTSTLRTFILLSQILPISFTATLFIVHLHLHIARQSQALTSATIPPRYPTPSHKPYASPLLPTLLLNLALLSLPSLYPHTIFIPLVLFSRLILLLPYINILKLNAAELKRCGIVTVGCVVAFHVLGRKELWLGERKRVLREGGFAVRALGWDALIGMGVSGVVGWGGGL